MNDIYTPDQIDPWFTCPDCEDDMRDPDGPCENCGWKR